MFNNFYQRCGRLAWVAVLAAGLAANLAVPGVHAQDSTTAPAGGSATMPPTPAPTGQDAQRARALDAFDNFMQTHPDVAKEVQANPSLLSDTSYVSQHPELQDFMKSHPGLARAAQAHPDRLMKADEQFRKSGYAMDRTQLKSYDTFMKDHPNVGEEIRKNPSLASNEDFIKSHPEYEQYLQDHPGVRTDLQKHPEYFVSHAAAANAHAQQRTPRPAAR